MDAQLEQHAAATLLNEGTKVPVTAPLFFRWFGKKDLTVHITPPSQGTLHRLGSIGLSAGITTEVLRQIDEDSLHNLNRKYSWAISKIVATAWLNSFMLGNNFFVMIAAFYFRWHMDNLHQLYAARVIDLLSNKKAFTNTIELVSGLRLTAPNLSQKSQGS